MPSSAYRRKQLDPSLYTVAWIAPLEIETLAAKHMLDVVHKGQFPDDGGDYTYIAGEMCGHNVIIAMFPAGDIYGTGAAAALASHIKTAFRNIRVGLLVGVAAGIPRLSGSLQRDIRLGDILVAMPDGDDAAVVAYDLGKATATGFEILRRGHSMDRTASKVSAAIGVIKRMAPKEPECFGPFYDNMKDEEHASGTFADPGQDKDQLYDDEGHVVPRASRRSDRRTRVWYGPIGSGEKLMKNAQLRDELRANHNVLGLEMEAAGTMNTLPVGVIRGVCDYADPHKNKQWQPYAAAMAAAYAKAILEEIPLPRHEEAPDKTAPLEGLPRHEESTDGGVDQHSSDPERKGASAQNYVNGANHGAMFSGLVSGNLFQFGQKSDASSLPQTAQDQLHLKVCEQHLWSSTSRKKFAMIKSFDSADWIFRQSAFRQWQSPRVTDTQVASPAWLTIKGKAFTGKSTLMGNAVHASLKSNEVITLYHFFGGVSTDPTGELLRDLLGQILSAMGDSDKPWHDIRRWSSEIEEKRCIDLLSCDRLREEIIRIFVARKDSLVVRIFVDAIDDCYGDYASDAVHYSEKDQHRPLELLEILSKILDAALAVRMDLGICVSCRQQSTYLNAKPPATTISLVHYMDEVIKPFIREKLQCIPDHTKVMRLLLRLSETGAHNFQWATAVCREIIVHKDCVFEKLEEIASKVVEDHEDVYCRAIRCSRATSSHDHQRLLHFLQVALGAFRPLTANEFRHAYAAASVTKFGGLSIAKWETSDQGLRAEHFENFLLDTTGGLLEIVTCQRRPRYTMKDSATVEECPVEHHVLFQQRSTESFLRSERGLLELGMASAAQLNQDCHRLLFRICGSILEKCSLRGEDDILMVDYACEHWLHHSRMCGELPRDLPGFMKKCTHPKAQLFIKEQIGYLRMKMEFMFLEEQKSMMVLLATLGCKDLLRRHLDTCEPCGTSLPSPSDVVLQSDLFMTSLCNAIQARKFETAMYLLRFLPPQHVDERNEDNQTLLYMTCCSAHDAMPEDDTGPELVKVLLERGASPCVPSAAVHEFPLHFAIGEADEPLIQVLCRGYQEREPENFVELLEYEHGTTGWPPLHYALKCERLTPEERVAVLSALREAVPEGADLLTLQDSDGKNPKDIAEEIGDYAIIDKVWEFDD